MKSYADAHCDTIVKLMKDGETLEQNSKHLDLMRLRQYGPCIQVFALWLEPQYYSIAMRQTIKYLDFYHQQIQKNAAWIGNIHTYTDLLENREKGKVSAVLALEGGEALEGELSALRIYHQLGVRLVTLTWNHRNALADGVLERESGGGLTQFGKTAIKEMERLGILIDVSHLSDAGFQDVAELAKIPFIASHSNARAVCGHPRNLTNEQLRTIGEAGGFVGLNFYPPFVAEKASVTMDDLIRQLTHMLDWAGEDAVGLGSDFDGIDITPTDLRQVEDMACFLERLEREFGEKTAAKIREENFLRVAKQVWK